MPTSQKRLAINWALSTMSGGAEVLEGNGRWWRFLLIFGSDYAVSERLSINCDVCTFSTDAPAHSHDTLECMKYLSVFVLKQEPDSVLEPDQWFEARISMILVIDSVGKPLGHPNKIRVT